MDKIRGKPDPRDIANWLQPSLSLRLASTPVGYRQPCWCSLWVSDSYIRASYLVENMEYSFPVLCSLRSLVFLCFKKLSTAHLHWSRPSLSLRSQPLYGFPHLPFPNPILSDRWHDDLEFQLVAQRSPEWLLLRSPEHWRTAGCSLLSLSFWTQFKQEAGGDVPVDARGRTHILKHLSSLYTT